jgi:hypothetical protein
MQGSLLLYQVDMLRFLQILNCAESPEGLVADQVVISFRVVAVDGHLLKFLLRACVVDSELQLGLS